MPTETAPRANPIHVRILECGMPLLVEEMAGVRTAAVSWLTPAGNASDPEACIDCGLCVDECPVQAIFPQDDVPAEWRKYIQINADHFKRS